MKYVGWFLFVLLMSIVTGCSSIDARINYKKQFQWEETYAGTDKALENAVEWNMGAMMGFPPLLLITIPSTAVDIVASTVVDTILLPVELLIDGDYPRVNRG